VKFVEYKGLADGFDAEDEGFDHFGPSDDETLGDFKVA
jgi:hypothetical protein